MELDNKIKSLMHTPPILSHPDNRTRSEKREDFENELAEVDRSQLENLIENLSEYDFSFDGDNKKETIKALRKFVHMIDEFDALNSQDIRALGRHEEELKMEAIHDWRSKWRTLFFRALGAGLFIVTIFLIGYIEHAYDWARLPMSSYINPGDIPK